ncbi:MAG TPA: hypothetical protein DCK95_03935 [Anaerolineaceae bacterium]|nr:hypothetical protein [Anaerolineaceae bacterium]
MMDLETVVKRIDALERQVKGYDKSFKSLSDQVANLDNKIERLPAEYHDLKDDINQLRKTIASLKTYDKALEKVRKDTNDKFINFDGELRQEREKQSEQYQTDFRSLTEKIERMDGKIRSEVDKKIQQYVEEESHILLTVEKIEQSVAQKLKKDEDIRRNQEIHKKDIQAINKRVEIISDDISQFPKIQIDLISKVSAFTEDLKQIESQLGELKTAETQRKLAQNAFIEQQEINQKNREARFEEIQRKNAEEIQPIAPMLDKLEKKEKELAQFRNSLEESTRLYERRLKEISELYQLFETKYQKEWDELKANLDKSFSNFTLINEEKQSAFVNRMDELKTRMTSLEDELKDIQELLGLMGEEVQKGMLSLIKMGNNWKEAFDALQGK